MLDCDKRAEAAKMDQDEMLKLVEEFNPLLVSCARKYQFAPYEDLFSIANVGFITAVKSYSSEKGISLHTRN